MKNDPCTAARIISEGGVVIIPTDTIYGLSCDPRNIKAVERLKKLKVRSTKPFLILDSSFSRIKDMFSTHTYVVELLNLLINYGLWPGQITLIADSNETTGHTFGKKKTKIGIRYTGDPFISSINDHLDYGIISTSVNISGKDNLTDINSIKSEWSGKVDRIFERGFDENKKESSIIELNTQDRSVSFIRSPDVVLKKRIISVLKDSFKICL
ncbi:MAG: Sua5/YciO/YrdC/YwlC family protein [Candidatus Delongbacteria bacterium]